MLRAALYARFSTDQQSAASIPDQLRACRALAAELGAQVALEDSDAAISGQAIANRPGLLNILAAARAGRVDLVVAEHTDRLSRSGGDTWTLFEDLRALGVGIHTVGQGRIGTMHVGLSGTMSALMIEETARKTRRGLEGVTRDGRSAGGLAYGYRKVLAYDAAGEPIRGLREVVEAEAAVVRRIFSAYAAGASCRAIANQLNQEGVPGPSGAKWSVSTLAGNAKRGNGVIHNRLYRGEIVWGRSTFTKDRTTGRRRSRANAAESVIRQDAPELRIIDDDLWEAVRARHGEASRAAAGGRPVGAKRPKRLLSGLVACGLCGGQMTLSGPKGAMRCATRTRRGEDACSNTRAPAYGGVESRVLVAIKANLLHPAVVEQAVREFTRRRREAAAEDRQLRAGLERELAEVKRRADRLVDQLADGAVSGRAIASRLEALEARRDELDAEISAMSAVVVEVHPAAAGNYRRLVENLEAELEPGREGIERDAARNALRALISEVKLTPLPAHGQYSLEVIANVSPLVRGERQDQTRTKVGAGTGFEPVTFRL